MIYMITDIQAKSAKPKDKSYRLGDGGGLYLRIDPNGKKYWIYRYWEQGHEHNISLGPYPVVSIRDARDKRDTIRRNRANGISPTKDTNTAPDVAALAAEWLKVRMRGKSDGYLRTVNLRLKKYIIPAIGDRRADTVTSGDVLRLCRRIESLGHVETAHRVKVIVGQVMRYGIAAGYIENDVTAAISGALSPYQARHYPTMTERDEILTMMNAIKAYPYPVMRCALLFSVYTAARPGEVRHAEWTEIKGDIWDIPGVKMKMGRRHVIPLSPQAQKVIEELRGYTGGGKWLFPSARGDGRPMSENSARVTLRSLGFGAEKITPHGFRAMFSTAANEAGFNRDVIERELAHVEHNSVRAAYNHAEYLNERVKLMAWWGDWLDGLI